MHSIDIRILGHRKYMLLEDLYIDTSKYRILVAKGMVFNGADVPRVLWSLIGCPLDFPVAAAVHDALYRSRVLSRYEADNVFYELLKQQGIDAITARKMYLGVRIGGESAYESGKETMAEYRNYVRVEMK